MRLIIGVLIFLLYSCLGQAPAFAAWEKVCGDAACLVRSQAKSTDKGVSLYVKTFANGLIGAIIRIPGVRPPSRVDWVVPGLANAAYIPKNPDCDGTACVLTLELGEAGVSEMKRGKSLTVTFSFADGNSQSHEVSLKGFTRAYDSEAMASGPSDLEKELQSLAEETRQRISAGEGDGVRKEVERTATELGLTNPEPAVSADDAPMSKEEELAAAKERVKLLEKDLAAEKAAANGPLTTQIWTKICPDRCVVQNWTSDGAGRPVIVAASLDEAKFSIYFHARHAEGTVELAWSLTSSQFDKRVVASCTIRGCTAQVELKEIMAALASAKAREKLVLSYLAGDGSVGVVSIPTTDFLTALVSAPLVGGKLDTYVATMATEVARFRSTEAAASKLPANVAPDKSSPLSQAEITATQGWLTTCAIEGDHEPCTTRNWALTSHGRFASYTAVSFGPEGDKSLLSLPPDMDVSRGIFSYFDDPADRRASTGFACDGLRCIKEGSESASYKFLNSKSWTINYYLKDGTLVEVVFPVEGFESSRMLGQQMTDDEETAYNETWERASSAYW